MIQQKNAINSKTTLGPLNAEMTWQQVHLSDVRQFRIKCANIIGF